LEIPEGKDFARAASCEAAFFYFQNFGLSKTAIRRIATIAIDTSNFVL
jgi:hypothetical protein